MKIKHLLIIPIISGCVGMVYLDIDDSLPLMDGVTLYATKKLSYEEKLTGRELKPIITGDGAQEAVYTVGMASLDKEQYVFQRYINSVCSKLGGKFDQEQSKWCVKDNNPLFIAWVDGFNIYAYQKAPDASESQWKQTAIRRLGYIDYEEVRKIQKQQSDDYQKLKDAEKKYT
jgi:hypothetical protein